MKNGIFWSCSIIMMSLLLLNAVSAIQASIIVKSPADNTIINEYKQDFIYSFDADLAILNCSLIVDGDLKTVRNSLIVRDNNKLSATLASGSHEWYLVCYDSDNARIESKKQSLTVNASIAAKEGYDIVYQNSGVRSYVITPFKGAKIFDLPFMKAGEDIRAKTAQATYYIDLLKMGSADNSSFVEVRDRKSGKIHRLLQGASISLDFDDDKVNELMLTLKDVERNVNALFTVTPYPGLVPEVPQTLPDDEEPVETGKEEQPAPIEPEKDEIDNAPTSQPESPDSEISINNPVPEEAAVNKSGNGLVTAFLIGLAIIIILIVILIVVKNSKSPKSQKKTTKEKKLVQEATKPEAAEEAPKQSNREDFEIIRSSGKRRR